jgi:hypothetical protein
MCIKYKSGIGKIIFIKRVTYAIKFGTDLGKVRMQPFLTDAVYRTILNAALQPPNLKRHFTKSSRSWSPFKRSKYRWIWLTA